MPAFVNWTGIAQFLAENTERVRRLELEPSIGGVNGCSCDFCTGVKKWADWCASCGNVRLRPDQHWENMDVCDVCDDLMAHEGKTSPDALECPPRPGSND